MQFQDQIVIITGAGQGIGRTMARAFANEGAKIVIAEIDAASGQALAEELGPERALFYQMDVRDAAAARAMVQATLDRWGRADVLINNAGVFNRYPSEDLPEEELDRVMDINFKGAVLCSQAVAKLAMIPQQSGRIISMSSINGLVGFPERLSYNCSKAAIDAMTHVLAIEWAKHNITVNAIAPGYVRTEAVDHHIQLGWYDEASLLRRTPIGRLIAMEDIAAAALFLASPAASSITGVTIPVDGGWVAYGYL